MIEKEAIKDLARKLTALEQVIGSYEHQDFSEVSKADLVIMSNLLDGLSKAARAAHISASKLRKLRHLEPRCVICQNEGAHPDRDHVMEGQE